jgi:hypothetical protein
MTFPSPWQGEGRVRVEGLDSQDLARVELW